MKNCLLHRSFYFHKFSDVQLLKDLLYQTCVFLWRSQCFLTLTVLPREGAISQRSLRTSTRGLAVTLKPVSWGTAQRWRSRTSRTLVLPVTTDDKARTIIRLRFFSFGCCPFQYHLRIGLQIETKYRFVVGGGGSQVPYFSPSGRWLLLTHSTTSSAAASRPCLPPSWQHRSQQGKVESRCVWSSTYCWARTQLTASLSLLSPAPLKIYFIR